MCCKLLLVQGEDGGRRVASENSNECEHAECCIPVNFSFYEKRLYATRQTYYYCILLVWQLIIDKEVQINLKSAVFV